MIEELYIGMHIRGIRPPVDERQATSRGKRRTELATMRDRLLNAYLAGTIIDVVYQAKSNELTAEAMTRSPNWAMWTRLAAKQPSLCSTRAGGI